MAGGGSFNPDGHRKGATAGHRLNGVLNQVIEDLKQLLGVGVDVDGRRRDLIRQSDACVVGAAFHEAQSAGDDFAHIVAGAVHPGRTREIEHPLDGGFHPRNLFENDAKLPVRQRPVGALRAGLDQKLDAGERIAKFMRHPRRHLSQCRQSGAGDGLAARCVELLDDFADAADDGVDLFLQSGQFAGLAHVDAAHVLAHFRCDIVERDADSRDGAMETAGRSRTRTGFPPPARQSAGRSRNAVSERVAGAQLVGQVVHQLRVQVAEDDFRLTDLCLKTASAGGFRRQLRQVEGCDPQSGG